MVDLFEIIGHIWYQDCDRSMYVNTKEVAMIGLQGLRFSHTWLKIAVMLQCILLLSVFIRNTGFCEGNFIRHKGPPAKESQSSSVQRSEVAHEDAFGGGMKVLFISEGDLLSETGNMGFSELRNILVSKGFTVAEKYFGEITHNRIDPYDIVVFSVDWWGGRQISHDEAQVIYEYVNQGSGLLLVGEHGLANEGVLKNKSVNNIGKKFGMTFHNNMVCDPTDHLMYETDPDNGVDVPVISNFVSHQVTSGIKQFFLGYGCSLSLDEPVNAIAYSDRDSWLDQNGVYHQENGYYECIQNSSEYSGQSPVGAVHESGYGRVLALSDMDWARNWALRNFGNNKDLVPNIFSWLREKSENKYEIIGISINGNKKSTILTKNNILECNPGDNIQFIGKAEPNQTYTIFVSDPILRQTVMQQVDTDNEGIFYYPDGILSTYQLPQNGTYVFRFDNGQEGALSSTDIQSMAQKQVHPQAITYDEIGPRIDSPDLSIDPDVQAAINHIQMVQNGETLPTYTEDQIRAIHRGNQKLGEWAETSFKENVDQISTTWDYISYAGLSFTCTTGIITAPAHLGLGTFAACTPLALKLGSDVTTAAVDSIEESGKISEDGATYMRAGTEFTFAAASITAGDVTAFDQTDFILSVAEGSAELTSVQPVYSKDKLQYINTTWNYTVDDVDASTRRNNEARVELLVHADGKSKSMQAVTSLLLDDDTTRKEVTPLIVHGDVDCSDQGYAKVGLFRGKKGPVMFSTSDNSTVSAEAIGSEIENEPVTSQVVSHGSYRLVHDKGNAYQLHLIGWCDCNENNKIDDWEYRETEPCTNDVLFYWQPKSNTWYPFPYDVTETGIGHMCNIFSYSCACFADDAENSYTVNFYIGGGGANLPCDCDMNY